MQMEGGDVANDPYWKEARDILDKIARGSAILKGASDLGQSVSKLRASIGDERVGPDDLIGHNDDMAEPLTREELIARIEANEARSDARFVAFEKRVDDTLNGFRAEAGEIRAELRVIETKLDSVKGIKGTIIGVGVTTALAVIFGIGAFNSALVSNMIASHSSGKDLGAALESARQQQVETASQLSEIRAERAASQAETDAALAEIRQIVNDLKSHPQVTP